MGAPGSRATASRSTDRNWYVRSTLALTAKAEVRSRTDNRGSRKLRPARRSLPTRTPGAILTGPAHASISANAETCWYEAEMSPST